MKFEKLAIKGISIILLVWGLVNAYLCFNHIHNVQYSYYLFVLTLVLVMVFFNWCMFNKKNEQSLYCLANNDPIEFSMRILIICLALVIIFMRLYSGCTIYFFVFLVNDAYIYCPQKNVFNKGRSLYFIIFLLLSFAWSLWP